MKRVLPDCCAPHSSTGVKGALRPGDGPFEWRRCLRGYGRSRYLVESRSASQYDGDAEPTRVAQAGSAPFTQNGDDFVLYFRLRVALHPKKARLNRKSAASSGSPLPVLASVHPPPPPSLLGGGGGAGAGADATTEISTVP